jgi:hypothetical protein
LDGSKSISDLFKIDLRPFQKRSPTFSKSISDLFKNDLRPFQNRSPIFSKTISDLFKNDFRSFQKRFPIFSKTISANDSGFQEPRAKSGSVETGRAPSLPGTEKICVQNDYQTSLRS